MYLCGMCARVCVWMSVCIMYASPDSLSLHNVISYLIKSLRLFDAIKTQANQYTCL